jgi:protoporphyrinogen oxidase
MDILGHSMGINGMSKPAHITILGGGPAGLAVGYYAKKNALPFTIYEASNRIGGNAVTLRHGDFLFDSGAHRFHDKDAEVTKEVTRLLGEDLKKINVPNQIYHNGKFIDFPLSPLNLMKNLGAYTFAKAAFEMIDSRLRTRELNRSFESFALHTYGDTIADCFLLNYSEKLWGASCNRLSSTIAGKRMKGLTFRTFLMEGIFGRKAKTEHLEGSFYYPKMGIGTITEKLGEFCGEENILRNSKITKILHNHTRIQAVEVNGKERIDTDEVVSTLPLNLFLQMMEPMPPKEILLLAQRLRYRNVILVALFLNRESVTEAATIYFPDPDFPFTRIYEPKARSIYMSPPGKTSLVAEIPCQQEDNSWSLGDDKLIQIIRSQLIQIGWIREEEIIDASVSRIAYGYPILEIGFEEKVQKIDTFLKGLSNLRVSGRNGKFIYAWVHNMMRSGKEIVEEYIPPRKNEIAGPC